MTSRDRSASTISLIATGTLFLLLVCSIAMNLILWRLRDSRLREVAVAKQQLSTTQSQLSAAQSQLRTQADHAVLMKSMLGVGVLTNAEFDVMQQTAGSDPGIAEISRNFVRDMALLGPDVASPERNYPNLAAYLKSAVKARQTAYDAARKALQESLSPAATQNTESVPRPE